LEFNEAQLQAVHHFEGPCLALAGPGSGKTTVLTWRIIHLIEQCHVPPENILVITFTRMAAAEMKERFLKLSEGKYKGVWFGTFHAVFFMILKHAYNYRADNIIKTEEQYRFLKAAVAPFELEIADTNEMLKELLSTIGKLKSAGISTDADESKFLSGICPPKVLQNIYRQYNEYLSKKRLIDFEDMQLYCYELFNARQDILDIWQEKFKYILIDEFQDICELQFNTINLIAQKYQNLFIVGDDDQSIYGFRGASPDYMRIFQEKYPQAVKIDMGMNYRSRPDIVYAARSLISHNKNRMAKNIVAAVSDISGELSPNQSQKLHSVLLKEFEDSTKEYEFLIQKIQEIFKEEKNYCGIAVLTRTNMGASALSEELVKAGIPFVMKEQIKNIYNHWIALDLIAYIQLAMGDTQRKTIFRILNKPLRFLSREAFSDIRIDFDRAREYYRQNSKMAECVDELQADILFLQNRSPFTAIHYIRHAIGYEDYIREYSKEHHENIDDLLQILNEIQESAKKFNSFFEWFAYIEKYTQQLEEQQQEKKEKKDGVSLVTMHSSKGLEYKYVFIVDINEGIVPYHRAVLEKEIEEERRMFYVAMTRAKEKLYLFYTQKLNSKKTEKSRFLDEIDTQYMKVERISERKL
jgi:DNA helicase-2/ATP-dependent DNA helicase PcrA